MKAAMIQHIAPQKKEVFLFISLISYPSSMRI